MNNITDKSNHPERERSGIGLYGRLRKFSGDESGVLVAFSVFFVMMILFIGALGVDLIRFEKERTRLQHAVDQAVLAAADLDQKQDANLVVADYFKKTGVPAKLVEVKVDSGLNYRTVKARAKQTVPTQLVHMLGVDEFSVPAFSVAEERADKVEISLVLDVSTSMKGTRITALRPAAKDFVTSVLDLSDAEDVSINVVPFSTQVAVPLLLKNQFALQDAHDKSHCLNFESGDFSKLSMKLKSGTETGYKQTEHFDLWSSSEDPDGLKHSSSPAAHTVCSTDPSVTLVPLSNNESALHTMIEGMKVGGNTSADVGLKWGAALLDHSNKAAVDALVDANMVDTKFSGRPYSYDARASIKVIVVMSDGANSSEFKLKPEYASGYSEVWYNKSDDLYALKHSGLYYPQTSAASAIPKTRQELICGRYNCYYDYISNGRTKLSNDSDGTNVNVQGPWRRLTYPELFAQASMSWAAQKIYYNFDSNYWNNWYWGTWTELTGGPKNTRMQAICKSAKESGIVIYSISFEAGETGSAELLKCASTENHYFEVGTDDIGEAFDTIAQSISQLKLKQ